MRKEVYLFGIIFLVLSLSLVSAVWWNPWTWFEKPLLEPVTPNCVGNYIGEIGLNDCAQVNTSDCGNSYIGAYGTYSQCGIDQGVCSMVNSFACNGPSIASICTPNCVNRNCGPDGCLGGSCGTCAEDEKCNDGICEETCIPKTCVDFNGCGTFRDSCGNEVVCNCQEGQVCNSGECCTLKTCSVDYIGQCGSFKTCGQDLNCGCDEGTCISGKCCTPKTCEKDYPGKCGKFDSGCYVPGLPDSNFINCGCAEDEKCDIGTCIKKECVPDCRDKNCGSDGCPGGTCGTCAEDEKCNDGICEETCIPKTCGHNEFNCNIRSDGCGGWITCYSCEEGKTCMFGRCYLNAQNNGHLINTLLIGLNIPDKDELVNNAIADFIKNWVIS